MIAALERVSPEPAPTDTGSLAGDISAFVTGIAASVSARREAVIEAIAVEAGHNDELKAALRARFTNRVSTNCGRSWREPSGAATS